MPVPIGRAVARSSSALDDDDDDRDRQLQRRISQDISKELAGLSSAAAAGGGGGGTGTGGENNGEASLSGTTTHLQLGNAPAPELAGDSGPPSPDAGEKAQSKLARERWSKLRAVVVLASRVNVMGGLEAEDDEGHGSGAPRVGETAAAGNESTSGADNKDPLARAKTALPGLEASSKYYIGAGTPETIEKAKLTKSKTQARRSTEGLIPGVRPELAEKLLKNLKGKSIRARLTTQNRDLLPIDRPDAEKEREALQNDIDAVFRLDSGKESPFGDNKAAGDGDAPDERKHSKRAYERVQAEVFDFMTNTEYSFFAWLASTTILLLIFISSVTFCLETLPELEDQQSKDVFYMLEVVCVAAFTVEYVLKFWSAAQRWIFFKQTMNLIDFVAILPFYVEIALGSIIGDTSNTRIVRIIRLVRVFRVLKLGGRFGKMQVVGTAVMESMDMLGMLMFLLILSMVLFSTLAYYAELSGDVKDDFPSIPATFWWCIVTLMTVGYGDVIPVTPLGKLVASVTMIASIIITALPISVIGAHFTTQWVRYQENDKLQSKAKTVIPNHEKLVEMLKQHKEIFKEIVDQVAYKKKLTETKTGQLGRIIHAVAGTSINRSLKEDNGNQIAMMSKVQKRKNLMDDLITQLEAARSSQSNMEELFAIADHLHSTGFTRQLERSKLLCRKLRIVGEDSNHMFKQIDELDRELTDLEDSVLVAKVEYKDDSRSSGGIGSRRISNPTLNKPIAK